MSSGPNGAAGSRPSPEPELPGEFVSEDLRADCGRFLDELLARVELRRELAPESGVRVPSALQRWHLGQEDHPSDPGTS
jgi:hypothetical protein